MFPTGSLWITATPSCAVSVRAHRAQSARAQHASHRSPTRRRQPTLADASHYLPPHTRATADTRSRATPFAIPHKGRNNTLDHGQHIFAPDPGLLKFLGTGCRTMLVM
jgi:hypothetical protein